jgi:hypothetical protein
MNQALLASRKAIRRDTPTLSVESFTTTVGPYRISPFPRGPEKYGTQFCNALQGRFGLSAAAAERLKSWMAQS